MKEKLNTIQMREILLILRNCNISTEEKNKKIKDIIYSCRDNTNVLKLKKILNKKEEIVDINHNEELDDNFKDDIMTLDRNHTMTRNQNGTMIENITPEMKNVIELMASNYNNNEPEPKGKEKSPFFV